MLARLWTKVSRTVHRIPVLDTNGEIEERDSRYGNNLSKNCWSPKILLGNTYATFSSWLVVALGTITSAAENVNEPSNAASVCHSLVPKEWPPRKIFLVVKWRTTRIICTLIQQLWASTLFLLLLPVIKWPSRARNRTNTSMIFGRYRGSLCHTAHDKAFNDGSKMILGDRYRSNSIRREFDRKWTVF